MGARLARPFRPSVGSWHTIQTLFECPAAAGSIFLPGHRLGAGSRIELAGAQAAQCFDDERKKKDGALKDHYVYAMGLSEATRKMPGRACQGGDGKHWWCFHGTPTMAVFADTPPTGSATQGLHKVEPHDRWLYINPCVTGSP